MFHTLVVVVVVIYVMLSLPMGETAKLIVLSEEVAVFIELDIHYYHLVTVSDAFGKHKRMC